MEKQVSRSSAKSMPASYEMDYDPRLPVIVDMRRKTKPSRNEISRCINIWARVYRLHDIEFDGYDLQMPSRTWAGRLPPRIERFV